MAGGPHAQLMMCLVCLDDSEVTKATRVHEGVESDQYRCEKGRTFGVDFRRGPATEPEWPPPPEVLEALKP